MPLSPPADVRELLVGNREFRLLFSGHVVSVVGDSLYTVAAMWLVWSLSGSTGLTGLAGVLTRAPQALQAMVGPVVDRADLGRVLVLSEVLQFVVVLVVPLAALAGVLNVWVVLATMGLLEVANLFAGPAQVAAVPRLVEDRHLVRANSLGSVAGRAARSAANAAAGVAVATTGAVALYLVDAATFAIAATLLFALRVPGGSRGGNRDGGVAGEGAPDTADGEGAIDDTPVDPGGDSDAGGDATGDRDRDPNGGDSADLTGDGRLARYLDDLRAGVALVRGSTLWHLLVASLLTGFLGGLTVAVLPAFADAMAGAAVYGGLVAARNAGGFLGSVAAPRFEHHRFGHVAAAGFAAAGLVWLVGVLTGSPTLTAVLFGAAAVVPGVYNVLVGAVLQTGVPEGLLGRVRAVVGSAKGIVVPLGLASGGLAGEWVAVDLVVLATGVGYLLVAGYYLAVPSLRRFPPAVDLAPGRFATAGADGCTAGPDG